MYNYVHFLPWANTYSLAKGMFNFLKNVQTVLYSYEQRMSVPVQSYLQRHWEQHSFQFEQVQWGCSGETNLQTWMHLTEGVSVSLEKNPVALEYFFNFLSLPSSMHDFHHSVALVTIYLYSFYLNFFSVPPPVWMCVQRDWLLSMLLSVMSLENISVLHLWEP